MPEMERGDYAVFRFLNKEDAELVATGLSTSKGVKVKVAKENTCPLDPDKPYHESICKEIDDVLKKYRKGKEKKKREKEHE